MQSAFRNGLMRLATRAKPLPRPPILHLRKYAMAAASHLERFYADKSVPYCSLNAKPSFDLLTAKEKLYAHYLAQYVFILAVMQALRQWTFGFQGRVGGRSHHPGTMDSAGTAAIRPFYRHL